MAFKATAKLVSYSVPTAEMIAKGMGTDLDGLVSYCARVSNPSNQLNTSTNNKLLKYLIKHKHWSPFEMASACMEIHTTRDIARQVLRHRSFAFQEFSQRYANPIKSLKFIKREGRLQDNKNRQNSIKSDDDVLEALWQDIQSHSIDTARDAYQFAIANGIAKEQARVVLPEGNIESVLYMNGTLRSWMHYIEVREANGTQLEHVDLAKACKSELATVFPLINDI